MPSDLIRGCTPVRVNKARPRSTGADHASGALREIAVLIS